LRMDSFGKRLRARALELGLSDAEVSRRVGISQTRYANYVSEVRRPDFDTLRTICEKLGTTPNQLLAFESLLSPADEAGRLRQRIVAAINGMDERRLATVLKVVDAMADD